MKAAERRYLEAVAALPCRVCGVEPAGQAHHPTGAGMALKASHYDAMPLCYVHHDDLHRSRGFAHQGKGWRRAWEREQTTATRETLASMLPD